MDYYNQLKSWALDHKKELVFGVGVVLMFFVGLGVGKYEKPERRQNVQTNYTTPTSKAPESTKAPQVAGDSTSATSSKTALTSGDCFIKGNISSNSKIYHIKGGAFYDRTNAEQCFNSEAEAQAAGFRKSSR